MKNLLVVLAVLMTLILMLSPANAQTDQTSISPPLSQPLVREGDFAMKLADSLKLGASTNESEAESALSAVGIAPRNGWIADYPITPDIVGELQTAVSEAAKAGRLAMAEEAALSAFQDAITEYNLDVQMDASGRDVGDTSGVEYSDSTFMNDYYSSEGPPVVTYYAPPPDYAYLYTWVPYPFWWWNYWFPGFFVLADFDGHDHGGHDRGHDRGRGDHDSGHRGFVSNHYRDPQTGKISRIDPTNRFRGGTLPGKGRSVWSSPSAQSGARSIVNTPRRTPSGKVSTGTTTTGGEYRGYGAPRSSVGTRSSVFDRSVNRGIERSSSDRGFQSRTNAGQPSGRGAVSGTGTRGAGAGAGSSRGGGGGFRSGGGGFHGGGGRR